MLKLIQVREVKRQLEIYIFKIGMNGQYIKVLLNEDIDGDGNYNPSIDIPGIPGADQTVWYVANDLNPTFTFNHMGSPPIGIEFQATFWAYKSEGPANNIIFKKYLLINKSQDTLEEMYLSMFMDPDVGDASDDLVGIDTSLGLGFAYNSNFF